MLFARAREAAGRGHDDVALDGESTLGAVLDELRTRYGAGFAAVLDASRVWVNGDEPVAGDVTTVHAGDEVAVLPPVSGGC